MGATAADFRHMGQCRERLKMLLNTYATWSARSECSVLTSLVAGSVSVRCWWQSCHGLCIVHLKAYKKILKFLCEEITAACCYVLAAFVLGEVLDAFPSPTWISSRSVPLYHLPVVCRGLPDAPLKVGTCSTVEDAAPRSKGRALMHLSTGISACALEAVLKLGWSPFLPCPNDSHTKLGQVVRQA